MDFDFSDDQQQLRDAVRRWVDKGYTFERRRSIVEAGGFSREAWGELDEGALDDRLRARGGGLRLRVGAGLSSPAGHSARPSTASEWT